MSAVSDDELRELRRLAFGVAYRMLGTVADADDVAQDSMVNVVRAIDGGERIESPRAYVATVATRRSIDELRSARVRRETYVGEWLPEPLVTDLGPTGMVAQAAADATDPAGQAEVADSLSTAFLVLLESLSPEQRAALLLHDVFGYGYDEVGRIVGTSTVAARQLVSRARRHVRERRPRTTSTRAEQQALAERFYAAARDGDLAALETLLAGDVELHGDGGGLAPALAKAVVGRARVARALAAWSRTGTRTGMRLLPAQVNGAPGVVATAADGAIVSVISLHIAGGVITRVDSVVNPEKLRHLGPVADLRALLRSERGLG